MTPTAILELWLIKNEANNSNQAAEQRLTDGEFDYSPREEKTALRLPLDFV